MGGWLIDILVVAVIAAFGWMGSTLGLVRSSVRLVAAVGGMLLAILLQEPLGALIQRISPASEDLASLLAMVVVGMGAYVALAALVSYYATWKPADQMLDLDRWLGAIPGALLGAGWCVLMVALVVLLPSNNPVTLAAIESKSGGLAIEGMPSMMRWLRDAFPHYTQTLPKGDRGALTRELSEDIPVRVTRDPRDQREEAGTLLSNINAYRRKNDLPELQWNLEVAAAARRHSEGMLEDRFFAYEPPDGGLNFEDRMKSALGNNVPLYDRYAEQIAWSHSVANAYAALIRDPDSREVLLDENLSEIGIGASYGGWFNGYMFTIGMLGRVGSDAPTTEGGTTTPGAVTSPDGTVTPPATPDPSETEGLPDGTVIVPDSGNPQPVPPPAGEEIPPGAGGTGFE